MSDLFGNLTDKEWIIKNWAVLRITKNGRRIQKPTFLCLKIMSADDTSSYLRVSLAELVPLPGDHD